MDGGCYHTGFSTRAARVITGRPGNGTMRKLITLMAVLTIAGCKQAPELPSIISPYRIDVQQGNVITQEMVGKLKAGQTRSQVRFVLGSPLVTDMFHSDRWDYIYLLQRQGKPDERRRLTVIFDDDKLLRLEGDIILSDQPHEPDALIPKPPAAKSAPPKPAAATVAPKPVEKPPVAATRPEPGKSDSARVEAAKAEAAKAEAAKADAATAAAAKAEAAKVDAAKADTAKTDAGKADAAKADTAAADEKKEPPKRGMFGRMLDKIGF